MEYSNHHALTGETRVSHVGTKAHSLLLLHLTGLHEIFHLWEAKQFDLHDQTYVSVRSVRLQVGFLDQSWYTIKHVGLLRGIQGVVRWCLLEVQLLPLHLKANLAKAEKTSSEHAASTMPITQTLLTIPKYLY